MPKVKADFEKLIFWNVRTLIQIFETSVGGLF